MVRRIESLVRIAAKRDFVALEDDLLRPALK